MRPSECVLTWECWAGYGLVADWSAVSALTREVNTCWKRVLSAEWGGEGLRLLWRRDARGGEPGLKDVMLGDRK